MSGRLDSTPGLADRRIQAGASAVAAAELVVLASSAGVLAMMMTTEDWVLGLAVRPVQLAGTRTVEQSRLPAVLEAT